MANSSETVRVIVRCRPMNQREIDLKSQSVISMDTQQRQVFLENIEQSNDPPKQFSFDSVYPEDSITENIYADVVFPLVESVLEGYNATVFAYGQTGCGKSYTMQGINTPGSLQRGVIPRSFEHIFEASAVTTDTKYLIRASYLEIYNETIRDLLGKDVKATLDLKEHVDKGVHVQNLTWHQCTNVVDCERLMDKGNRSRATGATLMNKDSSRSHSIFTILTEMCSKSEIDGKDHIRAGKLNLVDLAGSERQSKTHAEGDRLREATRINLSLSALGNVISALVDGRSKHIPYRDSKLTRLLQDSLGGNTKTLMIAAISPAHDNYEETLSTLRYANRAKNIKNKPRINEDPRDAQMKLLQEEINRLKQELLNAGTVGGGSGGGAQIPPSIGTVPQVDYNEEIENEKNRLRAEFDREASELRRECEEARLTREEIQRKYDDLKGQYDRDIDNLNANKGNEEEGGGGEQPPTDTSANIPGKITKKIGGGGKPKRNGELPINGQLSGENGMMDIDAQQKLERLHELENKFVGGEEANNEERKKKRKKKLIDMQEKLEQRKRFATAMNTDNEDVLFRVFNNVQEELHYTDKVLEKERVNNKRLQKDNDDLQHEFELERQGYLNTIRAQEKQLLLFRTMLDKMSGLIQRGYNYSNVEKIIEQARYDEEKSEFILPDPIKEEVQFPQVGGNNTTATVTNGRVPGVDSYPPSRALPPPTDYEYDFVDPPQPNSSYYQQTIPTNPEELERRYGRNGESSGVPTEKVRIKRQEQLLNENALLQRNKLRPIVGDSTDNNYMNRRLNPFDAPARITRKYGFSSDKQ